MKNENIDGASFETWTAEEVARAWDANEIVLIDVRTPQEYMFEHIEGALLLPMSFFNPEKLPGQTDKRIVFYCGSGMRSEKVSRAAIAAGFKQIAHMEDGFAAWKKARQPYIATNMATGAPRAVTP